MFGRHEEIPKIFYSEETEEPFARCIDCECDLLTEGLNYTVQKVFVRKEAVFEYAMCRGCAEKLRTELSEGTQLAYQSFLFSSAGLSNRVELVRDSDSHQFDEWIESCLVCHKSRNDCYRFSLCGLLSGSSLILAEFPAMICDDCEREMGALTSKDTQDRWNRFVEENFDGPPGIESDSPYTQPMLI